MSKILDKDLWIEILLVLKSNKTRTIVTSFGVFWGIFIMILLLSASKGFEYGIKNKFKGIATNSLFVWTKNTTKEYKGMAKNRMYKFDIDDGLALKKEIKGLKIVSPRNDFSTIVQQGLQSGNYSVEANTPQFIEQNALKIGQGRYLNQQDIDLRRKVAIIGYKLVDELFEKDVTVIGRYIKIKGVLFKVVGVYKDTSLRAQKDVSMQQKIHIPFQTFSQVFNTNNKVNYYFITAKNNTPVTALKSEVMRVLKSRHKIHPEDDRAIGSFDMNNTFKKFNLLFTTLNMVSLFVGLMILISGIIGISNIMLIVIKERTKEIGIRRAIGATPYVIKKQILLESLFLTIVSGMCGVILSVVILAIVNIQLDAMDPIDTMILNPSIPLSTLLIIFLILIVFGLLAGMIPAQKAIKMKPINAIRTE